MTSHETIPGLVGVLETVLYVDDLAHARAFYEGMLGLRPIFADARLCALDVGGRSLYFSDPDRNLLEMASPGIWPIF